MNEISAQTKTNTTHPVETQTANVSSAFRQGYRKCTDIACSGGSFVKQHAKYLTFAALLIAQIGLSYYCLNEIKNEISNCAKRIKESTSNQNICTIVNEPKPMQSISVTPTIIKPIIEPIKEPNIEVDTELSVTSFTPDEIYRIEN